MILRRRQVEAMTGLSKTTIYARIAAGTFPEPIPLGEKAVGWIESEIQAWIESRIAARAGATIGIPLAADRSNHDKQNNEERYG
jgi:prophage regulatory protein